MRTDCTLYKGSSRSVTYSENSFLDLSEEQGVICTKSFWVLEVDVRRRANQPMNDEPSISSTISFTAAIVEGRRVKIYYQHLIMMTIQWLSIQQFLRPLMATRKKTWILSDTRQILIIKQWTSVTFANFLIAVFKLLYLRLVKLSKKACWTCVADQGWRADNM